MGCALLVACTHLAKEHRQRRLVQLPHRQRWLVQLPHACGCGPCLLEQKYEACGAIQQWQWCNACCAVGLTSKKRNESRATVCAFFFPWHMVSLTLRNGITVKDSSSPEVARLSLNTVILIKPLA